MISDTHGKLGWINEVPPCDILIHAGDICPDSWKKIWCRKDPGRAALWLKEELIPRIQALIDQGIIKHFVATFGNHDWIYRPEVPALNLPNIHFLADQEVNIMGLTIWGSPWSNTFFDWNWMQPPEVLAYSYTSIPTNIDVVVSHQPPVCAGYTVMDIYRKPIRLGSEELEAELPRINPMLVVCGHIHGGHGVYDLKGIKVVNAAYLDEQYMPKYPIEVVTLLKGQNENIRCLPQIVL